MQDRLGVVNFPKLENLNLHLPKIKEVLNTDSDQNTKTRLLGDELRDSAYIAANANKKNNKFVTILIPTKEDDYVKYDSVECIQKAENDFVEPSPSKRQNKKRRSLSRKSSK